MVSHAVTSVSGDAALDNVIQHVGDPLQEGSYLNEDCLVEAEACYSGGIDSQPEGFGLYSTIYQPGEPN